MAFDIVAELGCCRAGSKEECTNPPCPCNLEAWTQAEREQLHRDKITDINKARARKMEEF